MLAVKCSMWENWDRRLVKPSWTTVPPQPRPWGTTRRSKRVTMPKLLEPPLRALKRSALVVGFALTIVPDERTTWCLLACLVL